MISHRNGGNVKSNEVLMQNSCGGKSQTCNLLKLDSAWGKMVVVDTKSQNAELRALPLRGLNYEYLWTNFGQS